LREESEEKWLFDSDDDIPLASLKAPGKKSSYEGFEESEEEPIETEHDIMELSPQKRGRLLGKEEAANSLFGHYRHFL
jgi:hypothetical protein